MNLCPSCKDGDAAKAGSPHVCIDCGRLLGSRPQKGQRPPVRHFDSDVGPAGTRFRGRADPAMIVLPVFVFVALGILAAVVMTTMRPSPPIVAILIALPGLAIAWGIAALVHQSEVTISPVGITIRSFPLRGRSAGTYPRDTIEAFGWIRSAGHERAYSYHVYLALRDGRLIRVPFTVEGEGQSVHVARKLKKAFEAAG